MYNVYLTILFKYTSLPPFMKILYNFIKLNVGKIQNGGIKGRNIVLHSLKPGSVTLQIVHTLDG